jgi:hypothetical protein
MKRLFLVIGMLLVFLASGISSPVHAAPAPKVKVAAPAVVCGPAGFMPKEINCSYRFVFDDEFTAHGINWSKWGFGWLAGWSGAMPLDKSNCSEGNNNLYETANTNRDGHPYSSCAIYSNLKQAYGFLEFRSEIPSGNGFWPSDWLFSYSNGPEQDIMEQLAEGSNHYNATYHWSFRNYKGTSPYEPNLDNQYHVYAVKWLPGSVTFYFDDHPVITVTGNISGMPLRIIIDFLIGGPVAGSLNGDHFPVSFRTDWVRWWSLPAGQPGSTENPVIPYP